MGDTRSLDHSSGPSPFLHFLLSSGKLTVTAIPTGVRALGFGYAFSLGL